MGKAHVSFSTSIDEKYSKKVMMERDNNINNNKIDMSNDINNNNRNNNNNINTNTYNDSN